LVGVRDGGDWCGWPVAILVGLILAVWTHWYVASQGLAGDPAPSSLWVWVGLTALRWPSRCSVARQSLAGPDGIAAGVPLCLLSAGVALNLWVGYFPSVQAAWNE